MKVNILTAIILLGCVLYAQPDALQIPPGGPIMIDGKIDAKEWQDAVSRDLVGGGKVLLKHDGTYFYVGVRGSGEGWSQLYLSEGTGTDVYVLHASAALGMSTYRRDANGSWQPSNEFFWELRDPTVDAAVSKRMEGYLTKNFWVANNNNMNSKNEIEFKIKPRAAGVREFRIAVEYVVGNTKHFFPAALDDDALESRLALGYTPANLKFDLGKWARIAFEDNRAQADGLDGFWEGEVTRNGKRWRVNLNAAEAGGETKATVDFVDLDVIDVPFPLKRTENGYRLERPQPSGNPIGFDGQIDGDTFAGRWFGFGVEGTFAMKRGTAKPKAFREEEVIFKNGDVTLSGTLLLPSGNGKFPSVVITHGSSPNERTTYKSWARHFANKGIAALIYDKRGAGKSTGNTRAASMENLADDAIAAVQMLKARADIEAAKIGVAGHSQGGWIAPLAASRSKNVAFIIASAAAAVTPAEQSIYHRAGVMRREGMTEAEIEAATKLREKLYELNRKILANEPFQSDRAAISQELIANKDARWFSPAELPPQLAGDIPPRGALELLFFDPAPMWRKLKVPALVMWGDKDTVVPVEKSRKIVEQLQAKAGNKLLTIKIFPGVDHGNNVIGKDGEWDFPRVNTEFDGTMVAWVKELYKKDSGEI